MRSGFAGRGAWTGSTRRAGRRCGTRTVHQARRLEDRHPPAGRPRPPRAEERADCRGARKARLAARGVLAAWGSSLLPPRRRRAWARRCRGQPALFPTLRRLWEQYDHFGGVATPSQIPGIGFEARQELRDLLATLLDV